MRENGSRKRKIVKIATAVLLMVFIVVSALVLLQNWEKTQ